MDLRPLSVGELLDRAVTVTVKIAWPLGLIVAVCVAGELIIQWPFDHFVFSHLFRTRLGYPTGEASLLARFVWEAGDFIIGLCVWAFGTMAAAVAVEDFLSGTRVDVQSAFGEAVMMSRNALPVVASGVVLYVVVTAVPDSAFYVLPFNKMSVSLAWFLIVFADVGTALIETALFIACVHIVLRRTEWPGGSITDVFRSALNGRTLLAVLVVGILPGVALIFELTLERFIQIPFVVMRVLYYTIYILSLMLLYSFITLFYLDLCARHAGIDFEEDIKSLQQRRTGAH